MIFRGIDGIYSDGIRLQLLHEGDIASAGIAVGEGVAVLGTTITGAIA